MPTMPEDARIGEQEERQISVPSTPLLTRTEKAVWSTFAVVAILVIALPIVSHRFTLADFGAWVLVLGAVAISYIWFRNGQLRTAEWLTEGEYEGFLKDLHQPPSPGDGPRPD
jgi:hypothetical protein